MDYKDTKGLKELIREWKEAYRHGEGGRAFAQKMEEAVRSGYEQRLKEELWERL